MITKMKMTRTKITIGTKADTEYNTTRRFRGSTRSRGRRGINCWIVATTGGLI